MRDYFLTLKSEVVIAWSSDEPVKSGLALDEKAVRVKTNNPDAYIGLNEDQIFLDPLPVPEPSEEYKNTQQWRRWRLKQLFEEIAFTAEIEEPTTELQNEYDALLLEYNDNKVV